MKYYFAYTELNEIIQVSECRENVIYYQFPDRDTELFLEKRGYLRKAHNNPFASVGSGGGYLGGESEEHYNGKMKIVHEKKYFDTIFNQEVHFYKVVPEWKQGNKKPDLSCYDENDNLVLIIEIFKSNKKTPEDILELKKLNIPLVEIDINNDNRCKHLILPVLLESIEGEIRNVKNEIEKLKTSKLEIIERTSKEIELSKSECIRIENEIDYVTKDDYRRYKELEAEIKAERTERVSQVDEWLQKRKQKLERISNEVREIEERFESDAECRKGNSNIAGGIDNIKKESEFLESEIERVTGLIEINAWYSSNQTKNKFYIG